MTSSANQNINGHNSYCFYYLLKSTDATLGRTPLSSCQPPNCLKISVLKDVSFASNARNHGNWKKCLQSNLCCSLRCREMSLLKTGPAQFNRPDSSVKLSGPCPPQSSLALLGSRGLGSTVRIFHHPVNTVPRMTIGPGCLGLKTLTRERKYY